MTNLRYIISPEIYILKQLLLVAHLWAHIQIKKKKAIGGGVEENKNESYYYFKKFFCT